MEQNRITINYLQWNVYQTVFDFIISFKREEKKPLHLLWAYALVNKSGPNSQNVMLTNGSKKQFGWATEKENHKEARETHSSLEVKVDCRWIP